MSRHSQALAFSRTGRGLPADFPWSGSHSDAGSLLIRIGFKPADQRKK